MRAAISSWTIFLFLHFCFFLSFLLLRIGVGRNEYSQFNSKMLKHLKIWSEGKCESSILCWNLYKLKHNSSHFRVLIARKMIDLREQQSMLQAPMIFSMSTILFSLEIVTKCVNTRTLISVHPDKLKRSLHAATSDYRKVLHQVLSLERKRCFGRAIHSWRPKVQN